MSELMMTATATGLTVEQFWALPEPPVGERHQLIDGEIVVAASPNTGHQQTLLRLSLALHDALAGSGAQVLFAPLDVVLGARTVVQPDVLVYDADAAATFDPHELPEPLPAIAVEVLSPSTTRTDLVKKRRRYERAGIAEYWVVDWQDREVDVLRLVDGHYELVEELEADDVLTTPQFPSIAIAVGDVLAV